MANAVYRYDGSNWKRILTMTRVVITLFKELAYTLTGHVATISVGTATKSETPVSASETLTVDMATVSVGTSVI